MTERTSNAEAVRAFRLLADLLEIGGESAYRVGAYRRAAEGIARLSEPLEAVRRRGGLQEIPGVGSSIACKIGELPSSLPSERSPSPKADFRVDPRSAVRRLEDFAAASS
jgi:DNA polymerase/3'-5' exonuclease PolX